MMSNRQPSRAGLIGLLGFCALAFVGGGVLTLTVDGAPPGFGVLCFVLAVVCVATLTWLAIAPRRG